MAGKLLSQSSRAQSFYEVVDGSILSKELLERAAAATASGPMTADDAKALWTSTSAFTGADCGLQQISDIDLRTIEHILEAYAFDTMAKLFLTEAVKNANLEAKARAREQGLVSPGRRKSTGSGRGTPRSGRTPGSGARGRTPPPAEAPNAYQEIQRIEDQISGAKTVKQVERLQKRMERLLADAAADVEVEAEVGEEEADEMRPPLKRPAAKGEDDQHSLKRPAAASVKELPSVGARKRPAAAPSAPVAKKRPAAKR